MSKADYKIVTAFAFAENLAHMIISQGSDEKAIKLSKELKVLALKAIEEFPAVTQKQFEDHDKRLKKNLSNYKGKEIEAVVHTSFVLAYFDEPFRFVKTPWKVNHIHGVMYKVMEIHDYLQTIMTEKMEDIEVGFSAEKVFQEYIK